MGGEVLVGNMRRLLHALDEAADPNIAYLTQVMRRSAHVLNKDRRQLRQQLLLRARAERLGNYASVLESARSDPRPALLPAFPSEDDGSSGLKIILSGHAGRVNHQPSVITDRVHRIESEVGGELLHNDGTLTLIGRHVLLSGTHIIHEIDELLKAAHDSRTFERRRGLGGLNVRLNPLVIANKFPKDRLVEFPTRPTATVA